IRAMRALLEQRPDLDALFAASDLMAAGALQVLREAGRRVPEDVAVVGFDDSPFAASTVPPLSSVRQPIEEWGRELTRLLLGGLGTGSIGRDHDGRFSRWHLAPGGYLAEVSPGSWLGLQVAGEGPPVALVAAGSGTRPAGLAPPAGPVGEYEALFPFAWYRY